VTDRIFPELSDAQLLKRHLQGDPDAFASCFCGIGTACGGGAAHPLRPEEAADALQEAMISGSAGPVTPGDSAVTTWLHRIW